MTSAEVFNELFIRFILNAGFLLVLLRGVYFRVSQDRDSLFGFFLFGHGVFVISALMHDVDISMGFAFGLFAVLSMLRYRTESISIRDMTYLFMVIVISLIFAVGPVSLLGLVSISIVLCTIVALCETTMFAPRTTVRRVIYDSATTIGPENRDTLIKDLESRLGVTILELEVGEVDLIRDAAVLRITSTANTELSS